VVEMVNSKIVCMNSSLTAHYKSADGHERHQPLLPPSSLGGGGRDGSFGRRHCAHSEM
jgi:hypothetical protein